MHYAMTIPISHRHPQIHGPKCKENVEFYSGIYILDDPGCGSCISYILGTHSIILKLWEKIDSAELNMAKQRFQNWHVVQKTDHTVTQCD